MAGTLKIYDTVKFSLLDPNLIKVRDDYSGLYTQTPNSGVVSNKGLIVRIAATHSGIITRNNGFYLPDKMKKGATSFMEGFGKPILKHHEDTQDSIGRVIDSRYIDTSGAVLDKFRDMKIKNKLGKEVATINDALIQDFCEGKMPFGMAVDTVRELLRDSILDHTDYEGLGFIQLTANISDPDSITKLLDGRFLTGSVGASTNAAVCSVCRTDWTDGGPCFPEDTEITMSDGSTKPIKEIQIGDLVLTHTGDIGKVTQLLNRHYNDDLIVLDRIGTNRPLFATKNHPIYHSKIKTVSHRINKSDLRYRTKVLVESGFIAAEELYENEGYVSTPIFKKDRSDLLSPKEAAFLGLYAAEGSNTNGNCLEFSFHKDEVEKFNHYFTNVNQPYHTYYQPNSLGVSCRFSNQKWKNLFEQHIGHGAKNKHLSNDIVFASDESIKSFLGAFIDGDGCLEKERNRLAISTASKNLAHQLMVMCNNIGITSNLYKSKNPGGPSNRDKECWIYTLQISGEQVGTLVPFSTKLQVWEKKEFEFKHQVILDDKIFVKFQTSIIPFHGTVYNLEIEGPNNEHSYIANDIAVHNCEHKPGGKYEGAKAFIIAGDLIYDEYSFVNKPADRHSKVLELNCNGIHDSIEFENNTGRIYEVQLEFPQYDSKNSKEEQFMKTDANNGAQAIDIQDSATQTDSTSESQLEQVTDTTVETSEEEQTSVEDSTNSSTDNKNILDLLFEEEGIKLSDEQEEELYDAMYQELVDAVKAGELTMKDEELVDAKLSTEKRKSLPKSSFCGPDRSFPVPDCAHVTAARRLIGRYKGPGNKDSISSCVTRKAKAMGCSTSSSNDSVEDNLNHARMLRGLLSVLEEDSYYSNESVLSDDEQSMLQSAIKRLASLVGKDAFLSACTTEECIQDSSKSEEALLKEIANLEDKVGELRDRLEANRKEYTELYQDYEGLSDALVEANTKTRKAKEGHLHTLRALRDCKTEDNESCFVDLSDSDLQSEIDQALKSVDMTKITDKLGDGMSRTPSGTVDDPSVIEDNTNSDKNKVNIQTLQEIHDKYLELRIGRGEYAAEAFLADMRKRGLLPQEGKNI